MGMSHSVEQSSPVVETEPMEVENPEEPEEEEPEEEPAHESFDWFLTWI